jgi:Flp pilus assembly protein TadG
MVCVMTFSLRMVRGHDDGTAAIEFALVLPVFLVVLLGILAYGIYFAAAHSTAQLAADAARASVAGLTDAERSSLARNSVLSNAGNYSVLIDPKKVTVEAAALASDATEFRVAVRYDAHNLPIWSFAPFLPLPSETIERVAVVKRGGY